MGASVKPAKEDRTEREKRIPETTEDGAVLSKVLEGDLDAPSIVIVVEPLFFEEKRRIFVANDRGKDGCRNNSRDDVN